MYIGSYQCAYFYGEKHPCYYVWPFRLVHFIFLMATFPTLIPIIDIPCVWLPEVLQEVKCKRYYKAEDWSQHCLLNGSTVFCWSTEQPYYTYACKCQLPIELTQRTWQFFICFTYLWQLHITDYFEGLLGPVPQACFEWATDFPLLAHFAETCFLYSTIDLLAGEELLPLCFFAAILIYSL